EESERCLISARPRNPAAAAGEFGRSGLRINGRQEIQARKDRCGPRLTVDLRIRGGDDDICCRLSCKYVKGRYVEDIHRQTSARGAHQTKLFVDDDMSVR